MELTKIQKFISLPRFNVYLEQCHNDKERALELYLANIQLSEALYPILSIAELSLRNAINSNLKQYFFDDYWFKNKLPNDMLFFVVEAERKLKDHRKIITADRIVAELNFGFWNRLFSRHNARLLWKPLYNLFPNLPKHSRKREFVRDRLNHMRFLRNRIYHYEPICWHLSALETEHEQIVEFITWLDADLIVLVSRTDTFIPILRKVEKLFI